MCLSVVAKVVTITNTTEAIVELGKVKKTVNLGLIANDVNIGDWVLIHTGFAIQIIDEQKAQEIIAAYDEIEDFNMAELV